MSLVNDGKIIAQTYKELKDHLNTNCILLDIFEGNLLPHVQAQLRMELSRGAYESCEGRIPPVNIEKRLIDKLSTIYSEPPVRKITGTKADEEMWNWYLKNFDINVEMQVSNEYFNMHRATALEPYLDNQFTPRLRTIPRDRFFVYCADPASPLHVTHFIKLMGIRSFKRTDGKNYFDKTTMVLYCYTDNEFQVFDEDGEVISEVMSELAEYGIDGTNPFGAIPFVYINKSKTNCNPPADNDLLQMTKLIPVAMTDINYALKFQSFGVFYTVDVDDQNLTLNPNTVISLKSDNRSQHKPEIGTIKPEVDSDKYFASVQEELALFLQSRGVRPGAVGSLTSENFSSGISKMVDEMDTTHERRKTIPNFSKAEKALFDLIVKYLHPVWTKQPSFEQKAVFSKDVSYSVEFKEQIVVKTRQEILNETEQELKIGLLSRETAMRRVNPDWNDEAIEEELQKIDQERTLDLSPGEESQDDNETPEV